MNNKSKKIIRLVLNTMHYALVIGIIVILSALIISETNKWPYNPLIAMAVIVTFGLFMFAIFEITDIYLKENFKYNHN